MKGKHEVSIAHDKNFLPHEQYYQHKKISGLPCYIKAVMISRKIIGSVSCHLNN